MRDLWVVLCVLGFTSLTGVVVVVGGFGAVSAVIEWREPKPEPPNRVEQNLRAQLRLTEEQVERERTLRLAAQVELDQLRRGAILCPPREVPVAECDRIPPQNLPTKPNEGK